MPDAETSEWRYQLDRVLRHVRWARTEGIGKLIEEDQLHPAQRIRRAWDKNRWIRTEGPPPGTATAAFLVGLQRSGTNMMLQGLEASPAVEVHNENDRKAFDRFRLRTEMVPTILARSRSRLVLFKPLCDSHDVLDLLALDDSRPMRAIWAYRSVDDRVRSAVAKFGDANRRALTEVAATGGTTDRWEAGGLDAEALDLVAALKPETLSAESAAALFWYLRNRLFFTLGLDRRTDVFLAGYEEFLAAPDRTMRSLCSFLDLPYTAELVAHVGDRHEGSRRPPISIDPRVRERCDELTNRFAAVHGR